MSYAIFRCEGVKSLSDLSNRGKHNKREKESYKTNPDIRIEDCRPACQVALLAAVV